MQASFNHKRFKTLLKISRIFSLVAMWVFIVAGLFSVVSIGLGIAIPKDFLTFRIEDLTIHQYFDLQLNAFVSQSVLESEITLTSLLITGGLRAFAGALFLAALFYLLKRIFENVEKEAPFSSPVIGSLKYIAFGFMGAGVVLPIFDLIFMRSIVNQLDHEWLNANYSLNMGYVLIGVLIYILMRIFEYGAYLQTQYDETV